MQGLQSVKLFDTRFHQNHHNGRKARTSDILVDLSICCVHSSLKALKNKNYYSPGCFNRYKLDIETAMFSQFYYSTIFLSHVANPVRLIFKMIV